MSIVYMFCHLKGFLMGLTYSCFLALLLLAGLFWKLKQKYDYCRRRQVKIQQIQAGFFIVVKSTLSVLKLCIIHKFDNKNIILGRGHNSETQLEVDYSYSDFYLAVN